MLKAPTQKLVATPVTLAVPNILFKRHGLRTIHAGAAVLVWARQSLGRSTAAVAHVHNSFDSALGFLATIIKFECQAILVLFSSLLGSLQRTKSLNNLEVGHMLLVLTIGTSDTQDELLDPSCKVAFRVTRC